MNRPTFDASHLPVPPQQFVLWLDVMGSGKTMARNLLRSANFVFKLHVAALEAKGGNGPRLYPMNDGLYAVAEKYEALVAFAAETFERLSLDLSASGGKAEHLFLCKGAIAFGHVLEGVQVPAKSSKTLSENEAHRNSVLLGGCVSWAYRAEEHAPPFGIYLHESARQGSGKGGVPFTRDPFCRYWTELKPTPKPAWVVGLAKSVTDYLNYCEAHKHELEYPTDRIKAHRELAQEFFA